MLEMKKLNHKQLLSEIFKRFSIDLVLDVGANTGQFASKVLSIDPSIKVISYEPTEKAFKSLVEKSKGVDNWYIQNFALGETPGSFEMNVGQGWDSAISSLCKPTDDPHFKDWMERANFQTETVEVLRLDSFRHTFKTLTGKEAPNIYLKTDTQGFDLSVFRGAIGIFDLIPAMQSEIAFWPIYSDPKSIGFDHVSEYQKHGYEVAYIYPVNMAVERLRLIDADVVFTRQK